MAGRTHLILLSLFVGYSVCVETINNSSNLTTSVSEGDVSAIPHMLIRPPPRSHAMRGETFVLSCQAVGSPTPRVTWYKDSAPLIGRRGRVSAFESGYLILSDTQLSDEGRYTCVAYNRVGVVSSNTDIIVTEHESGCADGVTDGLHQYEFIQACAGSWKGHVKKGGQALCRSGWQVCSPRHVSYLKMITWSDVSNQLSGCYGYNAANTLNLCTPCHKGTMAGVGADCSRHLSAEKSCLAEGRIDVYNTYNSLLNGKENGAKQNYKYLKNNKINNEINSNFTDKVKKRQAQGCHYTDGITTGVLCCKKPEKWQIGFNWKAPRCKHRCLNGGVCISNNICRCPPGYKGTVCQNPVCEGGCIPNSVCVKPGVCRCLEGYSGPKCRNKDKNSTKGDKRPELRDLQCKRPCLFGGKCKAGACKCPPHRKGNFCEKGLKETQSRTAVDNSPYKAAHENQGMID